MTDRLVKAFDVLIAGGGIVGSSLAMALGERGLRVCVLDIDLVGRLSSSERNAGGVRATWWQPVNIELCRASIDYYSSIASAVGFRQKGYLWLYDQPTWEKALARLPLQRDLSHPIEQLSVAQVRQKVPELDRLDGVAGATFSPEDGLINPNLLKQHYREKARETGATFQDFAWIEAIELHWDEVVVHIRQAPDALDDSTLEALLTAPDTSSAPASWAGAEVRAPTAVIAAGAWSPRLLGMAGLDCPTEAVRRQISLVDNRTTNLMSYGMIVDTTGLYFHNEGQHILAGYSLPEEPAGYAFGYDGDAFFMNEIWPRLYQRMSCCERLRHVGGWAGLYAVTPDRSAIVGMAAPRLYEAHSFSGRGVMQSWGVGQALAELIALGGWGRLDASALGRGRFASGALVTEELHI